MIKSYTNLHYPQSYTPRKLDKVLYKNKKNNFSILPLQKKENLQKLPGQGSSPPPHDIKGFFEHPLSDTKIDSYQANPNSENHDQTQEQLNKLVDNSSKILFKAMAVFPFDFFPNEISIEPNKINFILKEFFWSERIHSVLIKNISDVFVETNIFFGTLKIVDVGFTENLIAIKYLKKEDALKAKILIQGLVMAEQKGIDLSNLSVKEYFPKLQQLGQTK